MTTPGNTVPRPWDAQPGTLGETLRTLRAAIEEGGAPLLTPEQRDAERGGYTGTLNRLHAAEARVSVLGVELAVATQRAEAAEAAEAKLRAAVPAAPGPLERLEAWTAGDRRRYRHAKAELAPGGWYVQLVAPGIDVYARGQDRTLAAAIDAALAKAEERP